MNRPLARATVRRCPDLCGLWEWRCNVLDCSISGRTYKVLFVLSASEANDWARAHMRNRHGGR